MKKLYEKVESKKKKKKKKNRQKIKIITKSMFK